MLIELEDGTEEMFVVSDSCTSYREENNSRWIINSILLEEMESSIVWKQAIKAVFTSYVENITKVNITKR